MLFKVTISGLFYLSVKMVWIDLDSFICSPCTMQKVILDKSEYQEKIYLGQN